MALTEIFGLLQVVCGLRLGARKSVNVDILYKVPEFSYENDINDITVSFDRHVVIGDYEVRVPEDLNLDCPILAVETSNDLNMACDDLVTFPTFDIGFGGPIYTLNLPIQFQFHDAFNLNTNLFEGYWWFELMNVDGLILKSQDLIHAEGVNLSGLDVVDRERLHNGFVVLDQDPVDRKCVEDEPEDAPEDDNSPHTPIDVPRVDRLPLGDPDLDFIKRIDFDECKLPFNHLFEVDNRFIQANSIKFEMYVNTYYGSLVEPIFGLINDNGDILETSSFEAEGVSLDNLNGNMLFEDLPNPEVENSSEPYIEKIVVEFDALSSEKFKIGYRFSPTLYANEIIVTGFKFGVGNNEMVSYDYNFYYDIDMIDVIPAFSKGETFKAGDLSMVSLESTGCLSHKLYTRGDQLIVWNDGEYPILLVGSTFDMESDKSFLTCDSGGCLNIISQNVADRQGLAVIICLLLSLI